MMKLQFLVPMALATGILVGGCSANRIACPDVTGKKKIPLVSLFKKNEPTPEDQANEGRDIGGRNMEYDKNGLLTKKKVKVPAPKRKRSLLEKVGLK
ncbi:hypothetical protein EFA69_04330 [Rufibacter immobilis]|uniref:Lipoprotein n=1 Tax=Rufibacter immobilis TaxID=1348778 RepID=A0A3M9N5U0_9BACT|nr:hypothetical protein [Rufibacter immobilis]RNI32553.1 hypothetical protein EFA69_04330 [Rufibacter immobilis]